MQFKNGGARSFPNKDAYDILVIRLSALGDVAMTIPAIYSVARSFPQNTFHVLTSELCGKVFVNSPPNIKVYPFSNYKNQHLFGTLRLLMYIRRIPVDIVADLHNVLRSWIIDAYFKLRGKPVVMLDKQRAQRRAILNHRDLSSVPYTSRYFDVFARLGMECEANFSSLFLDNRPILPNGICKQQKMVWVGIAPFARFKNKTYPLEQMRSVVLLLAAMDNIEIFLFGSRGEESELMSTWCRDFNHVHCVAGKFSLDKELSFMAHLDVMVSMDSANMHLASLVGVRVISIWGSTTPACGFLGWKQKETDSLVVQSLCQPCSIAGGNKCRYNSLHCLTAIQPIDIVNKIKSTIKRTAD